MIEIMELSKRFKKVLAVDTISFHVAKGEIVGLVGENGAGKTTTLRMLATMLKPTGGTAAIGGYDILRQPGKVRGEIGILFGGEVGLYDRLTGRENIEYFAALNGMTGEMPCRQAYPVTGHGGIYRPPYRQVLPGMKQRSPSPVPLCTSPLSCSSTNQQLV